MDTKPEARFGSGKKTQIEKGQSSDPSRRRLEHCLGWVWLGFLKQSSERKKPTMASNSVLRSGASLLNRLSKSLPLRSNNPQFQSHFFPSLSKLPAPISPQNDAEFPHHQGFLYPCGLPSLRFFLPHGTLTLTIIFIVLRFLKGF